MPSQTHRVCHYNVLGISPDTSEDEARRHYKHLEALQWHPDRAHELAQRERAAQGFVEDPYQHLWHKMERYQCEICATTDPPVVSEVPYGPGSHRSRMPSHHARCPDPPPLPPPPAPTPAPVSPLVYGSHRPFEHLLQPEARMSRSWGLPYNVPLIAGRYAPGPGPIDPTAPGPHQEPLPEGANPNQLSHMPSLSHMPTPANPPVDQTPHPAGSTVQQQSLRPPTDAEQPAIGRPATHVSYQHIPRPPPFPQDPPPIADPQPTDAEVAAPPAPPSPPRQEDLDQRSVDRSSARKTDHSSVREYPEYPSHSGAKEWTYPVRLTLEELLHGTRYPLTITRYLLNHRAIHVKVDIPIPPGCLKGTQIRYDGIGNQCRDGSFQDVVFVVEEIPHQIFKRKHDDLYMTIRLPWDRSMWERRAELIVTGLDGQMIRVKMPSIPYPLGTETTSRSVAIGHGMPVQRNGIVEGRGNLQIRWKIFQPPSWNSLGYNGQFLNQWH